MRVFATLTALLGCPRVKREWGFLILETHVSENLSCNPWANNGYSSHVFKRNMEKCRECFRIFGRWTFPTATLSTFLAVIEGKFKSFLYKSLQLLTFSCPRKVTKRGNQSYNFYLSLKSSFLELKFQIHFHFWPTNLLSPKNDLFQLCSHFLNTYCLSLS